jgi:hypothetical protein
MKKIIIYSTIIVISCVNISCKKSSSDNKPIDLSITSENLKKFKNADGNIFMTLDEYFDQPVTLTSATLSAIFKKNENAVNVGDIVVNDKYNLIRNIDNNNYLLNRGIKANEFLNNSFKVNVNSKNISFSNIQMSIETTGNLKVESNIGLEGVLRKKQGLVLKWIPKNQSGDLNSRSGDVVYLGIAASGAKPITREVPDNGQVTLPASELAELPVNSQAVIRLGRVSQTCTTQNGSTVCVTVANSASSGPLTVQ